MAFESNEEKRKLYKSNAIINNDLCGVEGNKCTGKKLFHRSSNSYIPVYLATPLNVMSSIIVGSERPLALTANKIIRYELPGSKLSMKKSTGGRYK